MIVDTHTHFYDPTRPQGVPWPSPGETWLYRPVLPSHYRALAEPCGITGTVVVEASPWVEDNQWILDLAAGDRFILGLVGHLEPGTEDFTRELARFAANPLFRGIRGGASLLAGASAGTVRRDLGDLAERGLVLDLLIGKDQYGAALGLARQIPELSLVINHLGHVPIDGHRPDPEWADGVRRLAEAPGICMKLSGVIEQSTVQPAPSDPAFYAPTFDVLWPAFGEERLIFGSNWPVCERGGEFATAFAVVDAYFSARGPRARARYFAENGRRVYGWTERR